MEDNLKIVDKSLSRERMLEVLRDVHLEDLIANQNPSESLDPVMRVGDQMSLVTLSSETYRNTAVLVKEDLEKIGIGVEIEALDAQGYYAKSQVGEFDMCFTHPWKEPVTYYTWRCTYSDYDTMGTGFGFDPKFKDYFDVVSAGLDKEAIQDFFDMFWDEAYEFVPAVTLFSGGMARVYTDEVSGLAWQRGHGTLNLIDLSNVVVNRK